MPQIDDGTNEILALTETENPFVSAFLTGRGEIFNPVYKRRPEKDSFFNHDTAMVFPIKGDGHQLGVIGIWKRFSHQQILSPPHRELGMTIANLFALYAKNQKEYHARPSRSFKHSS